MQGQQMMRWIWAAMAAALVAGCGGGGGNPGTSPFGGGSTNPGTVLDGVASDLSLTLSATNINNSGSQTVVATATAVDASRNVVANAPVTISVDNNAVASVSGAKTDLSGKVTATVSIGSDRSNRLITVTAVSGGLARTATFQVTGATLKATVLPAVAVPGSTGNKIQYRLVDANSNAMPGVDVTVSAPGLTQATGTTDSNGTYEYLYTAPAAAGNLDVTAQAAGATTISTVVVQGSGTVPAASGAILSSSVSANPSVVTVNTTNTNNRSEIRALFLGASNQPIQNVRVRFDLPDPNSVGGVMSTGSSVVYSDASGVATSAYVPGSRFSPTNGVVVRACYSTTDFVAGTCPNSVQTTMTVISDALAVSIGTDATIEDGAGGLTYIKKFVVLVVDSSGQAKADVQLAASVDLLSYIKGYYGGPPWTRSNPPGSGFTGPTCLNEDLNRNGVLEANEDVNGNGSLDPRKSDVAISFVNGVSKTSTSGTAFVQIEYPKNVATWINYQILIAAAGVAGTEGRTSWFGVLPADVNSFTASSPPAFVRSPYGIAATCTDPN